MIGPPSISFTIAGPMIGNAAGDRCADAQSPVCVLIEAQHLSAERHAKRHEQQKNADDPGEFARKLVSAEKKDLHHVDEDNGDHEVGAPSVQRADEPAESDVVIEGLQAAPRFAGGGHVNQREQNAGDDLQQKTVSAALPNT